MYTLEEKSVGRFTVKLHPDYDAGWDWVLCDQPILIFARDRGRDHVQFDGTRTVRESMLGILRLADESYSWTDVLDELDADFDGTGPVPVRTLDGTLSVRIPRPVASRKTLEGDVIFTC